MTNDPQFGHFLNSEGSVAKPDEIIIYTGWVRDSRDEIIQRNATFVDPQGQEWQIYVGDRINGLSVPRFFWRLLMPYEGKFREASAFHDVWCDLRTRSSKETHLMFYNAMRANGVDRLRAWLAWQIVNTFGPHFHGSMT